MGIYPEVYISPDFLFYSSGLCIHAPAPQLLEMFRNLIRLCPLTALVFPSRKVCNFVNFQCYSTVPGVLLVISHFMKLSGAFFVTLYVFSGKIKLKNTFCYVSYIALPHTLDLHITALKASYTNTS